ncbi:hypothetical protein C2G38_2159950 [Gigaspora rosea]|uniref:Uncharacterized protein n=1 Tax=Gigaspora rosea TaxID=44941 RepID=A0A397VYS6_9GLOM|nr:hypothetical protein C2G38_2159950 [Gigaspora rosea]
MSSKFFIQLSQDFTQLLESEYDYNVVIEVGEKPNIQLFKGHSAILYQRSLYFRQKLVNAVKKNNIIEIKLPTISAKLFNIINYIYGGMVSLENFEVSAKFDLLIADNELEATELVKHLQSQLINDNASWLRIILNSDDFTTLQENALISFLKIDNLQMEESEIWDKVILWGKAKIPNLLPNLNEWTDENFKSLKITVQHCLPHIRYFQIPGKDVLKKIKPYRQILENTSIITPSSSIVTLLNAAEISSWIDRCSTIYDITEIPYEFKLLFRGGRDRFSGKEFHKLCDNIPGTVVIVKINSTDEILGGYNPLVWKFGGGYGTTTDSFIFSLKNGNMNQSILSRVINPSQAIWYDSESSGPWFDNDLRMENSKKCDCSRQTYDKCIRSASGLFSIDEFEVFQICKNT